MLVYLPYSYGQDSRQRTIDSLKNIVSFTNDDSIRVDAIGKWDNLIFRDDRELDLILNEEIKEICLLHLKQVDDPRYGYYSEELAKSLNIFGSIYSTLSLHDEAYESYMQSMYLAKKNGDTYQVGVVYNNLGNLRRDEQNWMEALAYYEKAMEVALPNKFTDIESSVLSNIGHVRLGQADSAMAEGNSEEYELYLSEAEQAIDLCLEKGEEVNQYWITGYAYIDQCTIYRRNKRFKAAKRVARGALKLSRDASDTTLQIISLFTLAETIFETDDFYLSAEYAEQAHRMAVRREQRGRVMDLSKLLYEIYDKRKDEKKALHYFQLFSEAKDSVAVSANREEKIKNDLLITYKKRRTADSVEIANQEEVLALEIMEQSATLDRKKNLEYGLYGGLGLGGFSMLLLFRNYTRKKRDNQIIRSQKNEVEEQKKKILESINYAQRIQNSVLPEGDEIRSFLPGFEALYKPRDIVGGDFYWAAQANGKSYVALADCTGHGVPGAFMSMIGSTLFKDIIVGRGIQDPALILAELDRGVKELLKQAHNPESNDGMEAAMIVIDKAANELHYAGARLPIYVVGEEVEMIKGDIRDIGGWIPEKIELKPFTCRKLNLDKIRAVYMTSDGLEDQFRSGDGKKFGRHFLMEQIKNADPKVDLPAMNEAVEKWQDGHEQIDDICLIGIKFNA